MSLFAAAIEKKDWELVALCLLYALAQSLAQLPPNAIEGALDALEERPQQIKGNRRGRKSP